MKSRCNSSEDPEGGDLKLLGTKTVFLANCQLTWFLGRSTSLTGLQVNIPAQLTFTENCQLNRDPGRYGSSTGQ